MAVAKVTFSMKNTDFELLFSHTHKAHNVKTGLIPVAVRELFKNVQA